MFIQNCKDWKRTTPANKTWEKFRTFFATAHQEWRKSQATTSSNMYGTAPFSGASANTVHQHNKTADAIACLATATASHRTTVATLVSTNAKVTAELSVVNSKLVSALHEIIHLTNAVADPTVQVRKSGTARACHHHRNGSQPHPLLLDARTYLRTSESPLSQPRGQPQQRCKGVRHQGWVQHQ